MLTPEEYYDRRYNQILADYRRRRITFNEAKTLEANLLQEAREAGVFYQIDSDYLRTEEINRLAHVISEQADEPAPEPAAVPEDEYGDEAEDDEFEDDEEDEFEDEEAYDPLYTRMILGHLVKMTADGSDVMLTIDDNDLFDCPLQEVLQITVAASLMYPMDVDEDDLDTVLNLDADPAGAYVCLHNILISLEEN